MRGQKSFKPINKLFKRYENYYPILSLQSLLKLRRS